MNKKLLPKLISICFLLSVNPVYAVQANDITQQNKSKFEAVKPFLTLFDAIDISVKNNYSLKLAAERINVARYQITENAAQGLPQLNITSGYTRQDPVNPNLSNNTIQFLP